MHIANPIYDVIFKYMLEDSKVARLFLSAIIGEEIEELDFSAQEKTVMVERTAVDDEKPPLTVCRVDFSAKIQTPAGFKTVTIELQKAKFQSDLMRFRRYLGTHYRSSDNTAGDRREKARQDLLHLYPRLRYGFARMSRAESGLHFARREHGR